MLLSEFSMYLTLSAHAVDCCSSHFVCLSVCLSEADLLGVKET